MSPDCSGPDAMGEVDELAQPEEKAAEEVKYHH